LARELENTQESLAQANGRLARMHPRRRFNDWLQRLDDLQDGLRRCAKQGVKRQRSAWQNLLEHLRRVRPGQILKLRRETVQSEQRRLHEQARRQLRSLQARFGPVAAKLALLGPDQVLNRGYSITTDATTGAVLRQADKVKAGQKLKTRLARGEVLSKVEKEP
jgi:exodeoxyribonuclease VII large subunit